MPPDVMMLTSIFAAVALLTGLAASALLRHQAPERQRLRAIARPQSAAGERATLSLSAEPNRLAERIARLLPRSAERMQEMRARLVTAGFRGAAAPVVFAASQIVCALLAGVVILVATGHVAASLFGLVSGFVLPGFWLAHRSQQRRRAIRNGLPDVLDLVIVCLESGCSLDQATMKTSDELALAYSALSDELVLVGNEIRVGTSRAEAFKRMAERTRDEDVRSFVAMLIQTDRYGTSIAPALRVHADLLRTRRRQRAEERAAKANVKLVVPLVVCLFPAFYILALGPAMLEFARVFLGLVGE